MCEKEIIGIIGGGIGLFYGRTYENKRGVKFKVVEYLGKQKTKIVFEEPFTHYKWVEAKHIRNGFGIRSPYEKLCLGVGYLGEGIYNMSNSKDAYSIWTNMLMRCYSDVFQTRHPSYKGCTVDSDWHNFQVFAEWYYSHESYGLGYHLDKDLLEYGNREYSEHSCCMLPQVLNVLISKQGNLNNGFPIGVKRQGFNSFRVDLQYGDKNAYLGAFDSVEKAQAVWKDAKIAKIKELAEEWKYLVTVDVYESLINLEV